MSSFLPEAWRELEERMREIAREEIAAEHREAFGEPPNLAETVAFARRALEQIFPQSPQSPSGSEGEHA